MEGVESSNSLGAASRRQEQGQPFHIRAAKAGDTDVKFIVDSFDSNLAFLAGVGSRSQWGTQPFSQRPAFVEFVNGCVQDSSGEKKNGSHVFIAEKRDDESQSWVSCGAAVLDERLPLYIRENGKAAIERREISRFIYLHNLISNRAIPALSRGAGDALLKHVKQDAARRGLGHILVDCWTGNDGALVRYYQRYGFAPIYHFEVLGKHQADILWSGALLHLKLSE